MANGKSGFVIATILMVGACAGLGRRQPMELEGRICVDGVLCALADELVTGRLENVTDSGSSVVVSIGGRNVRVGDAGRELPRWELERVMRLEGANVTAAVEYDTWPDGRRSLIALDAGQHVAVGNAGEFEWCVDVKDRVDRSEDWSSDARSSETGVWRSFVDTVWEGNEGAKYVEGKVIEMLLQRPWDDVAQDVVAWWIVETSEGVVRGARERSWVEAPALEPFGWGRSDRVSGIAMFSLMVADKCMGLPPGTLASGNAYKRDVGRKRMWTALQAFRAAMQEPLRPREQLR